MVNRFRTAQRTQNSEGAAGPGCLTAEREEKIRKKAYEFYEKRGCREGHALEDWLAAEKVVS